MRTLLHRAGKAWHFISTHIPGEHLTINSTLEVPSLLKQATDKLKTCEGALHIEVRDIEGCYPSMPKEIIRQAARDITRKLQDIYAREGVWVPKRGKRKCEWAVPHYMRSRYIFIPFVDLVRIMEFSLDHALIKMPDRWLD